MLINGVPTTVVMQQVISIADESGKLLDFGFAESLEAIERTGRRQLATLMLMLDVLKSGRDAPDRNDVYAMAEELLV